MSEQARARFGSTQVSPLVVYLMSSAAAGISGRIFELGGDALVAVDPHRPAAGPRAVNTTWAMADIARVIDHLVVQLPPEMTTIEAGRYMQALPFDTASKAG